jgi:hypothetical protein
MESWKPIDAVWHHTDGTICDVFSAEALRPDTGGLWWCVKHEQFVTGETK